jgi:cytidyltransferase-like protein
MAQRAFVSGGFDRFGSREVRLLQAASEIGSVTVLLWSDRLCAELGGKRPIFPDGERSYVLRSIRYVSEVLLVDQLTTADRLPELPVVSPGNRWVMSELEANEARLTFCQRAGLDLVTVKASDLGILPDAPTAKPSCGSGQKKVVVTGCYDWLHSGHVRFFEEVSQYGDLYVVLGHDVNIRALKGEGHPLFPQEERRYMVASIRFVSHALIATGNGWLDADPEIGWIKPDIYAVNEDGDRGGKREYCAQRGIEYLVLKRIPASGLPRRSSTDLRGF